MGRRMLPVERRRLRTPQSIVELIPDYLTAFGWMRVPGHLWRAMRRNAAWIEPTLIAEWMRLMRDYARAQNRPLFEEKMAAAMQWSDPARDVSRAREVAVAALETGSLHCSWTGRALTRITLDIDHVFPWTAWPCGDLWNLLPAHREVNQRFKRDRLPSATTLFRAEDRIVGWWEQAYLERAGSNLPDQFMQEARASLPGFSADGARDIFASVCLQRIRLRHDQQVPEWDGGS
jgi:hypothetical protein